MSKIIKDSIHISSQEIQSPWVSYPWIVDLCEKKRQDTQDFFILDSSQLMTKFHGQSCQVVNFCLLITVHWDVDTYSFANMRHNVLLEWWLGSKPVHDGEFSRKILQLAILPSRSMPLEINQVTEGFLRSNCTTCSYQTAYPPVQIQFRIQQPNLSLKFWADCRAQNRSVSSTM